VIALEDGGRRVQSLADGEGAVLPNGALSIRIYLRIFIQMSKTLPNTGIEKKTASLRAGENRNFMFQAPL
jgi:hypothetical protein